MFLKLVISSAEPVFFTLGLALFWRFLVLFGISLLYQYTGNTKQSALSLHRVCYCTLIFRSERQLPFIFAIKTTFIFMVGMVRKELFLQRTFSWGHHRLVAVGNLKHTSMESLSCCTTPHEYDHEAMNTIDTFRYILLVQSDWLTEIQSSGLDPLPSYSSRRARVESLFLVFAIESSALDCSNTGSVV